MPIPQDRSFDATRAFFREGYNFIGNRCAALGSDAFVTRLMLRRVVCVMGEDAARHFYDGAHFTRVGAMPQMTLRLLQDTGSVQTLDGAAHGARKALFLDLLTGPAVERIGALFALRWRAALPAWRRQGELELHHALTRLLTDVVCAWAGVPVAGETLTERAREFAAMIDGAGSAGPRAWRGLVLRRRTERWARAAIEAARQARPDNHAVSRIAHVRDPDGERLSVAAGAVELLNILRPTVAVARFIVFAALALHEHQDAAAWLADDPEARAPAFADEVRRFYPFFPAIGGRVRAPFEWRGHAFRPHDWVLLGLHATDHDARI